MGFKKLLLRVLGVNVGGHIVGGLSTMLIVGLDSTIMLIIAFHKGCHLQLQVLVLELRCKSYINQNEISLSL